MELAQVECPECGGSAAVEGEECPVCDGHGSVEGEVRTISLHNIRYELRAGGRELWRLKDGGQLLVASVEKRGNGEAWEIRSQGLTVLTFADEASALKVLESFVREVGKLATDLT